MLTAPNRCGSGFRATNLSLPIQQGLGCQGRLIQGPLGSAAGVAGLPGFECAPACFSTVFSGDVYARALIRRLCDEYPDGWALSMNSTNLWDILPMCPRGVRIASWQKSFAVYKPNVQVAYTWEPVVFMGGRKRGRDVPTVRDSWSCPITLKRGLTGAKPREFCMRVFDLLGAVRGDTLDDLFPGSGAVAAAWAERAGEPSPLDPTPLEALCNER